MEGIRLARIFGISVEFHNTFLLLIAGIALLLAIFDINSLVPTMLLLFFLFISVFLHELAHSLVSILRGIGVSKIILLPIGGISVTEKMPEKPIDEFLIAIAGPAFNFIVVLAILIAVQVMPTLPWPYELFTSPEPDIELLNNAITAFPLFGLFWVNFMLGFFNLLVPALPMDGGRVLRSVLSWKLGFARATKLATTVSSIISITLAIIALLSGNIILLIIAGFVYFGAAQEREFVSMKESFRNEDISGIIRKNYFTVPAKMQLSEVFEKMQKKNLSVVLVKEERGIRFISLQTFVRVKKIKWPVVLAEEASSRVPEIDKKTTGEEIFTRFLSRGIPIVAVKSNGKTTGYILADELQNYYELIRLKKQ